MTSFTHPIIFSSWCIYFLYWFISSQDTKATKEIAWKTNSATFFLVIIVIFLLLQHTWVLIPPSLIVESIGSILVIAGVAISIIARKRLARNWSKDVVLKTDHQLITTGIYHYVRHPIYSGFFLMGLGTVLANGTIGVFAMFLLMISFLVTKLRKEEALLTKHFPTEYPTYQKRTYALFPYIW